MRERPEMPEEFFAGLPPLSFATASSLDLFSSILIHFHLTARIKLSVSAFHVWSANRTKIYGKLSQDLRVPEARKEYVDYSPIGQINFVQVQRKKSGYNQEKKNRRTASKSRLSGVGKAIETLVD